MRKFLSVCIFIVQTTILVAQVSKTINIETAGTLSSLLTDNEKVTITDFTVSGNIDARDIFFMRDEMKNIQSLDISKVNIQENWMYPSNELPQMAFYNCAELSSVTLPDSITSTGIQSFFLCKKLKEVKIPTKVRTISSNSFEYCTSLETFIIPENVTTIEALAFNSCSNLASVYIPKSVTSLNERAFGDCQKLTSILIDDNNVNYSSSDAVIYDKYKTKLIYCSPSKSGNYSIEFKYTLKTIGDFAFCFCKNITSVVIPNFVDTIGNYAFYYGCPNMASVNIPPNLKYIGDYAFAGCKLSGTITIPSSTNFIGNLAFNCLNVDSITVNTENQNYSSKDGILYNKEKTKLIFCPRGKAGNIIIPENVIDIYANAFNYCQLITSVVLSNNIKTIGDWAFSNTAITSITIPYSTISIGTSAFGGCPQLNSVTLSKNIGSIGDLAFQACPKITSITIPDGIKAIGQNVFSNCTGLTSITIPSSIESIGAWAFANCKQLSNIYTNQINPISLNSNSGIFYGVDKNRCVLEVPLGSKSLYQSASVWNDFINIVEMITTNINLDNKNKIQIYNYNNGIIIDGTICGEKISILKINGVEIQNIKSNGERLYVPLDRNSVYFVKTKNRTFKIKL